jgi:hypothetical protein
MHALRFRRTLMSLTALALVALAPTAAQAATDHVTKSGDSGKPGQLRYVIAHAKSGDTIVIAAGVNPSLTQGEITVTKSLTLKGQGARTTTINAHHRSRIFVLGLPSRSHPTVSIADLTLTGGQTTDTTGSNIGNGGALIAWSGKLKITDVTLSGNKAMTDSPFLEAQGGAIANQGTKMSLNRVTMMGNESLNLASGGGATGGALLAFGPTTITNSTIVGNSAQDTGTGGSVAQGGGILGGGNVKLISSTLADNSVMSANVPMSFSDGGNIYVPLGTATFKNTIIAGGSARSGSNCEGSFADDGHNLESTTPSQCGLSSRAPMHDLIGTDPMFATSMPANNGGPTDTLALTSGSPAIDYIRRAACTDAKGKPLTVDQRGKPRPDDHEKQCDIGAFETQKK